MILLDFITLKFNIKCIFKGPHEDLGNTKTYQSCEATPLSTRKDGREFINGGGFRVEKMEKGQREEMQRERLNMKADSADSLAKSATVSQR